VNILIEKRYRRMKKLLTVVTVAHVIIIIIIVVYGSRKIRLAGKIASMERWKYIHQF
jgi:hypothetical protein